MTAIKTEEDLRALYGHPKGRAKDKVLPRLEQHSRRFIGLSPFCLMATHGADGMGDISPRGGAPGFVHVLDDETLALPDRPGNNRLDSLVNIVHNPDVGMLFLIPGLDETLRINGRALIVTDTERLDRFAVEEKRPKSVLLISVREAFLHCAKALMRSALWSEDAKIARGTFPTMGEMLRDQLNSDADFETQDAMLARYRDALY